MSRGCRHISESVQLRIRTRSRLADHRKLIGSGEIQPHSLRDHSGTLAQTMARAARTILQVPATRFYAGISSTRRRLVTFVSVRAIVRSCDL